LEGERFAALMKRHSQGVEVLTQSCAGLVEQVEAGDLTGPRTIDLLQRYTSPMLARGADTIVLGCTHYPFLRATLQDLVGASVTLIDTGDAVARQAAKVLADGAGQYQVAPAAGVLFYTSGEPDVVRRTLERLWGEPVPKVHRLEA
jgi:glutamate racemase